MSAYRDSLPPEQVPAYDAACAAAAQLLAEARYKLAEIAARGGPEAVAEAAYVPGGPSKEELAARFRRLQDEARAACRNESR